MDAAKRLTLVAAILGTFVAGIDATVINVALPAIEQDLGGGLAGQQWVVNAYLLFLGSLILVGGSLGDLYGERRVFRIGVAGFGVVSVLCALAPTIEMLVAGRALQGVFGALLTPSGAGHHRLHLRARRARRGDRVVDRVDRHRHRRRTARRRPDRRLDLVAAHLRGQRAVRARRARAVHQDPRLGDRPPARARRRRRRDALRPRARGAALALIEQPRLGWADPLVALPLVAGIALFAAFIWWERGRRDPMLPLSLFGVRNFAVGNVETFTMYAGLGVVFFFLVIYLQQVAGYDALEAGLATLPSTIVMFLLSKRFGALADRYGARAFMGFGPLVAASGLLLFLRVGADVSFAVDLLPALGLFSLGLSMTVAPLTATVLAAADESNAGIASAVNNAVARVAGLLAIAAVGAVVATSFATSLDDAIGDRPLSPPAQRAVAAAKARTFGVPAAPGVAPPERARLQSAGEDASTHAFHVGMLIAATLVAAGGLLGLAGIRDPRRRDVRACDCPGGQIVGHPLDSVRVRPLPAEQ